MHAYDFERFLECNKCEEVSKLERIALFVSCRCMFVHVCIDMGALWLLIIGEISSR